MKIHPNHPGWWLAPMPDHSPAAGWLLDHTAIEAEAWMRAGTAYEQLWLRAAMSPEDGDRLLDELCATAPLETPPPRVLARILRSIEDDELAIN